MSPSFVPPGSNFNVHISRELLWFAYKSNGMKNMNCP